MTSLLRRKRPITVRVPSMPARTACKLAGLAVLLLSSVATAQTPAPRPLVSPYATWTTPPTAYVPPQRMPSPTAALPPLPQEAPILLRTGGWQPLEQGLAPDTIAPQTIQVEPPGLERLAMSVQSDEQLQERIRQENRERTPLERVVFPPDPILTRDTYHGRTWDPLKLEVAPYYVCYGRLRFEEKNAERYGWDLGVLQPLVSGGYFLWDFVTLPYHLAMEPCRCIEYNTGYCLPGDPVPYLLYPPEISATGTVAEVGTILALVAIFP